MDTKGVDSSSCPLCGGLEKTPVFRERGHMLVVCRNCDLFFIQPYPDSVLVHDRIKTDRYEDFQVSDARKGYQTQIQYFNRYFPLIREEVSGASSFLDLGCGPGRLLELLKCFPNLYRVGVELNIERAAWAREKADCEIVSIPLEEMNRDRKFDVIAMINVLSHIPSFDELFSALKALLAAEGKLILKAGEHSRGIKKWFVTDWHIPDHLHFLGPGTISYVCKKYGFRPLRHDRVPLADYLFSEERWKTAGKSRVRNVAKKLVAGTPYALRALKQIYQVATGSQPVYSSFIVLTHSSEQCNQGGFESLTTA